MNRKPWRRRCCRQIAAFRQLGRDDLSSDTQVDVMTEEQLLRGLESMTPLEPSANLGWQRQPA